MRENIVVDGRTAKLNEVLLHDSREDVAVWIAKPNPPSTWDALRRVRGLSAPARLTWLLARDPLKRRKALKRHYLEMPFKPVLTFAWLNFAHFGFLDGAADYRLCLLRACHEAMTDAKVKEADQRRSSSDEPTRGRVIK